MRIAVPSGSGSPVFRLRPLPYRVRATTTGYTPSPAGRYMSARKMVRRASELQHRTRSHSDACVSSDDRSICAVAPEALIETTAWHMCYQVTFLALLRVRRASPVATLPLISVSASISWRVRNSIAIVCLWGGAEVAGGNACPPLRVGREVTMVGSWKRDGRCGGSSSVGVCACLVRGRGAEVAADLATVQDVAVPGVSWASPGTVEGS